ncbi:MAG: BolA family transcriptional regulator [Zetaproteobacteria bacterium]|nr:MAG: BolA family transcriptional regulator [Zetaproteobacteria bacterium]
MGKINADEIRRLVLKHIPDAEVNVRTFAGDDHFEMHVASRSFAGLSRVAQHQMVYAALGEHMKEAIHALALKTMVKE